MVRIDAPSRKGWETSPTEGLLQSENSAALVRLKWRGEFHHGREGALETLLGTVRVLSAVFGTGGRTEETARRLATRRVKCIPAVTI